MQYILYTVKIKNQATNFTYAAEDEDLHKKLLCKETTLLSF